MTRSTTLTIVLAAGKGTRMKSRLPKGLHTIAGRSLLGHVLATREIALGGDVAVVVGPDMASVQAEAERQSPGVKTYLQAEQRGTGDAVLAAREALAGAGDVFVLFCDTPLLQPETLQRMQAALDDGAHVAVLGFEAADPTGYGRLLTSGDGELLAIREHNDASAAERAVRLCNSGVMAFRCPDLPGLLDQITDGNAKHEFYLTDAVEVARAGGLKAVAVVSDEAQLLGINDRIQLAEAEAVYQRRRRGAAMRDGATLVAPDTVWFSHDTVLGQDVLIEPNVFFGPGVTVGDDVLIRANCHIEGASIGAGARIGPYARLRPGAQLGADVHVGNFVEVKNVTMGEGAKANHLTYLGDGSVGQGANIGAGTIFCNYDGFFKHHTVVGDGAFVGSNSSLVAPVKIGDGAFVGSGSVITRDVPADALSLERADQVMREGWAEKFRTVMKRRKAQTRS
ncbi:MAG: bifunctional UDP-N-acetylglucosamine diphosphorylase/glucosamine-1-phosphate N-acetyltransferase GlmU [Hyphomicrobiaceae bacterium]